MSTPADADVPLVHTSFTCTDETAGLLAKERAKRAWKVPMLWVVVVVGSLYYSLTVSHWGKNPALFLITLAISLPLLTALAFGGRYWLTRRRSKRALNAVYPAGTALRAEFGTHGFTMRSPRGSAYTEYRELKYFFAGTATVLYTLPARQLLVIAPRELFPESALALVRPHVKVRRRG
ncbi:MAG: hypothetical protein ACRC20_03370 [Segniliparus sp.]|uniref:hypothetical protein n=1 Tax=Segniliparus sp. TaxID=2804064 RepID=UPI003F367BF5